VKQSEVKQSEVVFTIQGRDSSDYVVTSYRLDGLGSFPGSIFMGVCVYGESKIMSCTEVVTCKMGFVLDLLHLNTFTQFRSTGNTALLLFYTLSSSPLLMH
jgi:hypothetical protein